jgi:hypothetical protein
MVQWKAMDRYIGEVVCVTWQDLACKELDHPRSYTHDCTVDTFGTVDSVTDGFVKVLHNTKNQAHTMIDIGSIVSVEMFEPIYSMERGKNAKEPKTIS